MNDTPPGFTPLHWRTSYAHYGTYPVVVARGQTIMASDLFLAASLHVVGIIPKTMVPEKHGNRYWWTFADSDHDRILEHCRHYYGKMVSPDGSPLSYARVCLNRSNLFKAALKDVREVVDA